MKKTTAKKTTNSKKTKPLAIKKSPKPVKKETPKTPKKSIYPAWTTPKHLSEKDHKNLKRFFELFQQGVYEVALNFAYNLDTILRDEIPADIWLKVGGKTKKPKAEKKPVKLESSPEAESNVAIQKPELIAKRFFSEAEMEDVVFADSKDFFGENVLQFKEDCEFPDEHYPDKFLIDFSIPEKPRIYLFEVVLSVENFGLYFLRVIHFFSLLKNKKNFDALIYKLHEIINSNKEMKDELQSRIHEETVILEFLRTLLENNPLVLLITSNEISGMPLFSETYIETWSKMFKTLVLRMFSNEEETTYSITPSFADLFKSEKSKFPMIVKSTEEDHLELLPTSIRNIYLEIKTALLETDSSLEFNPKKHYISVRKNKNLAFIQLKRKNIDIVVMNPLESTLELIKHHRIKTLPPSVQKFWNGACCTIVIENADYLEDVIELLRVVIVKV
ncbi:MAG: DUF5655 domain-containing protein [Candidatus Woesearchaeota archaeon]|jgi:predicted transport protein